MASLWLSLIQNLAGCERNTAVGALATKVSEIRSTSETSENEDMEKWNKYRTNWAVHTDDASVE